MPKALTGASVERARPREGRQYEIPDAKVPGLALRISASGVKSWTIRYRSRATGEQRRLTLGRHPSISLAKARMLAQEAIGDVAGGADPAKARRAQRASALTQKLSTVRGLIETYLDDAAGGRHKPNGRPKRASTIALQRYYFDRLIAPRFGPLAIDALDRHSLQRFLDDVGKTTGSGARHCRDVIREAFNYGVRRELIGRNPAQFAALPASPSRERVLSEAEVRLIWGVLDARKADGLPLSSGTRIALMLAMVTLQRGGEIAGIHAREIDRSARLWIIPGERTKNHRTQIVPLSSLATELLDRAYRLAEGINTRGEWVGFAFPSPRGKRAIDRQALSHGAHRAMTRLGLKDVTPHDFRRTGATYLTGERIGISRFVVSKILNQTSDSGGAAAVTGVYDRNEYLPEKRRALDAWASVLAEITSGKERSSNVVLLTSTGGAT